MTRALHDRRALRLVPLLAILLVAAGCGSRKPHDAASPAPEDTTPAATAPNPASDVGVSPTEVTIGLIVSKTSPLGPETFAPPAYGAQAFVAALNRAGGVA